MQGTLSKNLFTTDQTLFRSYQEDATKKIVFISYRRTECDKYEAKKCARILEGIDGLHYWLDEHDKCMQQAHAENDDIQKALCIEQGLDVSSALLGIIGRCTFDSPWIPYEIGGARGRQRYLENFSEVPMPHPLIAHLIHDVDIEEVPAFVSLGIPLMSLDEVKAWGESIKDLFAYGRVSHSAIETIQSRHGILDIYNERASRLKPVSLY